MGRAKGRAEFRSEPVRALRQAAKNLKRRLRHRLEFRLLDWRARIRRNALTSVSFIAVTGSCGKTTTARLIGEVLGSRYRSQTWINEPLLYHYLPRARHAVLSADPATQYFVYEAASLGPGTLNQQLDVLRPDIGVVTTIGTDHRRLFGSLEATAKEKASVIEGLPPSGIAILNAGDPLILAMAARTKARVVTYGLVPQAEVRGSDVVSRWPGRLALNVGHNGRSVHVATRLVGEHWATSILAAIACGLACGLDLETCAEAVAGVEPVGGRYSVHGKEGGPVFVLDTVKAPSWTIPASLSFVAAASATRKTIVFGTISDYASAAGRHYRRVATEALAVADRVIFVGPHSGHSRRLEQSEGGERLFAFRTAYEASAFLAENSLPDELILVKASRNADHLERVALAQLEKVACWGERCGKPWNCSDCKLIRRPWAPPFARLPARAQEQAKAS